MVIMGSLQPPIVMLGITAINVEKLKQGKPIRITAVTHPSAKDIIKNIQIVIFYGETEEKIKEDVMKAGFIGEETKVIDTPPSKPQSN